MSSLACKNVKIQDSTGTLVSTLSYDGTNVTIDKPIVATAPTAAAGTNTTQLATTAFAYGALSASTNGYQKLPSGLIIQWGIITGYQYEGTLTTTFPIAFPNNIFTAYASTQNTNGNADASMQVIGPSLTGMSVLYNYFAGTNGNGYAWAHWLAIGN